MTLKIIGLFATLSMNDTQQNDTQNSSTECHDAESCVLYCYTEFFYAKCCNVQFHIAQYRDFYCLLSVIMLNVIMLSLLC
jgi:hypothetical protein